MAHAIAGARGRRLVGEEHAMMRVGPAARDRGSGGAAIELSVDAALRMPAETSGHG